MSQSQSNKPSGSTTKLKYTYHDVLKMYEELDLKVCDDGNMIEEAYEKKKAKYVKMLKSPDPAVSAQAKWGMESYTTLSDPDKRKACLEEVYEKYKTQADISITGVVSEKTKTFDSVLAEQLKILAIELFNAVDDLAKLGVIDSLKKRNTKLMILSYRLLQLFRISRRLADMARFTFPGSFPTRTVNTLKSRDQKDQDL